MITSNEARVASETLVDVVTPEDIGVISRLEVRDGTPGAVISVSNPLSDLYGADPWYPLKALELTRSGREVVQRYLP